MEKITLTISHNNKLYYPAVKEGITWETERKGVCGKLTFTVLRDPNLVVEEGDPVALMYGGVKLFYGFVFIKKRDKDGSVAITAYDQLRYLKNKETYLYTNKTATEVIRMVADDFQLQVGSLADTKYVIPSRSEDNQTLFDIIGNALDLTLTTNHESYVLYDDYGKLTLKNLADMTVPILICEDTAESYSYESSIDGETYNKVRLYYDNKDTGEREIYQTQSTDSMNKWGVLQYSEKVDEPSMGAAKAEALLALYNRKTRSFTVSGAFGDTRVRGGSMVVVKFKFDDADISNFMIVEKVKHKFDHGLHTMDLTLVGSWGEK